MASMSVMSVIWKVKITSSGLDGRLALEYPAGSSILSGPPAPVHSAASLRLPTAARVKKAMATTCGGSDMATAAAVVPYLIDT